MPNEINLKIDNIKGESKTSGKEDWIDVIAWNWGMSQAGTFHEGGGGTSGKASFGDLVITKYIDMASAELMKSCATGEHFEKAELVVQKAGGSSRLEFFLITLEKVIVSSYTTGGAKDGSDRIQEDLSLNFQKFTVKYVKQSETGGTDGDTLMKFDIAANNKF